MKTTQTQEKKFYILFGLFIMSLILANILGGKIADFGLFEASVGIIAVPIMFLITDIIEEVFGKERAKLVVYSGLLTLIITLLIIVIAVKLPAASRQLADPTEYANIFGTSVRIFIASIIAFFLAQMHDVWAFNFWKEKTKGKYLWLRNNLSTIVSQFIDTMVFMGVAFLWANPAMTPHFVFIKLAIPYYLLKILFAILDTPLIYLGVWWLRKE
ncbi:queuosine precursor transporter [Candidatus Woesearchaeota archaeon]|nr:queuosine precursor transporter [Candidatus Woesearchaeota archaeon]